jgi:bla regulator protein blaR1
MLLLLAAAFVLPAPPAALSQAPAATAVKAPTFDVVSIKPNNSGNPGGSWGVSDNKYTARNTPLGRIILQAYLGEMSPPADRLKGAPSWVMTEPYDITAKADDATADSWKNLRQPQKVALAAPMLRAMLEDRCKLVAHTVPTEVQGYALVLGKRPLKVREAQTDEPLPKNKVTFEGGWMLVYPDMKDPGANQSMTYIQVTMAQFTAFLSMGGKPIVDQTGLTGKYDFELPRFDMTSTPGADGSAPPPPPDPAHMFDWGAIGLELKPIKVPARDLVIDHIEKPTEN